MEIETQLRFTDDDSGDGEGDHSQDEEGGSAGGQFDLVIQSTEKDHDFAIVAEVKKEAKIEELQISNYRRGLERNKRFQRCDKSRRYLIGVTNYRKRIKAIDSQINWSEISQILSPERPVSHSANSSVANVCDQFNQFLEEWGIVPMKLAKISPRFPAQWNHVHRLRGQIENILKEIRGKKFLEDRPMKPPVTEPGISGRREVFQMGG